MNKGIENGPFGKLIRTIGFITLLGSSLLLLISYANTFEFIESKIDVINNFVNNEIYFLVEYTHLILITSLILLVWTQAKSVWIKILLTLSTLLVTLTYYQVDNNILPEAIRFEWLKIDFYNNLLNNYFWLTYSIIAANLFLLYLLFGFKKPHRLSGQVLSSGLLILLVGVTVSYLPELVQKNWDITVTISSVIMIIGYLTLSFSGLFGVLGFARK